MRRLILVVFGVFALAQGASAQDVLLKTNLLYGGVTLTPNIGAEFALPRKSSLELSVGFNPWNVSGTENNNKKLAHWLGHVEYRRWKDDRFKGHFFGVHALGAYYNVNQYSLDYIFGKDSKNYRHEGYAAGAGVSYGYQWVLSERWNLEATLGLGLVYLNFDKFEGPLCGDFKENKDKLYLGPTKMGVKLIYRIR